jgi:DnaJ-class molecular chaperone
VASDADDSDEQLEESHGPRECMPCRGSGRVTSNLGGTPKTVTCPWCAGGGVRLPDVDAQAAWLERQTAAGTAQDTAEDGAA